MLRHRNLLRLRWHLVGTKLGGLQFMRHGNNQRVSESERSIGVVSSSLSGALDRSDLAKRSENHSKVSSVLCDGLPVRVDSGRAFVLPLVVALHQFLRLDVL